MLLNRGGMTALLLVFVVLLSTFVRARPPGVLEKKPLKIDLAQVSEEVTVTSTNSELRFTAFRPFEDCFTNKSHLWRANAVQLTLRSSDLNAIRLSPPPKRPVSDDDLQDLLYVNPLAKGENSKKKKKKKRGKRKSAKQSSQHSSVSDRAVRPPPASDEEETEKEE